MSNLISTIRQWINRLATMIGHMILRLALVGAVAVGAVWVGSAMGLSGYSQHVAPLAPAPAAAATDTGIMDTATAPAPVAAPTPATAAAPVTTPAPGAVPLVAVHSDQVTARVWNDLLDAGVQGRQGDGTDDVLYAPVNLVITDASGTWTVTADGPARCEHGAQRRCSGLEWVTFDVAPLVSPDGFQRTQRHEDGHGIYGASRYDFDPELRRFTLR